MFQRVAGIAILALSLAACGGKEEPKKERALTPPPVTVSPVALPKASPEQIEKKWSAADLATVFKASDSIAVEADDAGVILSRVGEDDNISGGRTTGAHILIEGSNELDYSNETIRISVTAKSNSDTPATFQVAYSTARKGNSQWQVFEATDTEASFTFDYKIREGHDGTPDYIGIAVSEGSEVLISEVSVGVAS